MDGSVNHKDWFYCVGSTKLYNDKMAGSSGTVDKVELYVIIQCDTSCLTCSGDGATDCLSCSDGLFLEGSTCKTCDAPCLTCSDRLTCTGCSSDFVLDESFCVSTCPNNKFDKSGICTDCGSSC